MAPVPFRCVTLFYEFDMESYMLAGLYLWKFGIAWFLSLTYYGDCFERKGNFSDLIADFSYYKSPKGQLETVVWIV